MSEEVTVGTGSELIHGTLDGAKAYVEIMYGETYTAWTALGDDPKKQTLAAAVRYLNRQSWTEAADTFDERDAIAAFASAQYELAVMVAADPGVLALADQGSNISAVAAGSASVSYFNPTTKGADILPPILMNLLGQYLAASSSSGPVAGSGQSGACVNPFASCPDLDRGEPY